MERFKDKVVVVTGAGQGLGKVTAKMFADEGAKVILAGRTAWKMGAAAKEIGGSAVLGMCDYQSGTVSVAELGVVGKTPIVGSNVLYFELDDGTAFIVRPSGTEPKIKVYILAQGESRADCDERIARYKSFAESLNK